MEQTTDGIFYVVHTVQFTGQKLHSPLTLDALCYTSADANHKESQKYQFKTLAGSRYTAITAILIVTTIHFIRVVVQNKHNYIYYI